MTTIIKANYVTDTERQLPDYWTAERLYTLEKVLYTGYMKYSEVEDEFGEVLWGREGSIYPEALLYRIHGYNEEEALVDRFV